MGVADAAAIMVLIRETARVTKTQASQRSIGVGRNESGKSFSITLAEAAEEFRPFIEDGLDLHFDFS